MPVLMHLAMLANDEYVYDDNGNLKSGGGRTILWSSFNKPTSFQKNGSAVEFDYGPDRSRFKKVVTRDFSSETTLYLGKEARAY